MSSITVVINTFNEEKKIEQVLRSITFADEIVVVDDGSTDGTLDILSKLKKNNQKIKVYKHRSAGYVEPARNFAISKASSEWVLLIDADEEVPETLAKRLQEVSKATKQIDFVNIPRKNIIFNKWIQNSFWWPDYNIRFFKKGAVTWSNKIHSKPETRGERLELSAEEQFAIIHHNYDSVTDYLLRMDRYSTISAKELVNDGYKFLWSDLISKPLGEFLSRYFANRGFEDGVHGLVLSLLQAFSHLSLYIKVWEIDKFKEEDIEFSQIKEVSKRSSEEIDYWLKHANLSGNPIKRFVQKVGNRFS